MAFGGDFEHNDEVMSEINMTPLVDVMLVLLIIFIITVPVLTHSVNVVVAQFAVLVLSVDYWLAVDPRSPNGSALVR